jgi:arylsulfatase
MAQIDTRLAHIDLLPSILSLCGIDQPDHDIDGISFFETANEEALAQRTLFFEWGRGFPVKYRNFAAIKGPHKLVGDTEADAVIDEFELYDLASDPYEQNNIVVDQIQLADSLKNEIDAWYEEIIAERNNNWVLPTYVGTAHENPTVLNRNDAKGTPVPWGRDNVLGYWDVMVTKTAKYNVTPVFIEPIDEAGNLHLKMYPQYFVKKNELDSGGVSFRDIELMEGEFKLEIYYRTTQGRYIFPLYVSIEKIN